MIIGSRTRKKVSVSFAGSGKWKWTLSILQAGEPLNALSAPRRSRRVRHVVIRSGSSDDSFPRISPALIGKQVRVIRSLNAG